jgi:hypothetical protein
MDEKKTPTRQGYVPVGQNFPLMFGPCRRNILGNVTYLTDPGPKSLEYR